MELQVLQVIWFGLFGVLVIGYAILDGFDLGVGALSLFAKTEDERAIHMASIAPVWDGNEVWLLTAGGALFAAFPEVYATVFSGFYLAFMLLLAALIFRAVSFEFRNAVDSSGWRRVWDWAFGLGSLVPALLYGVAVGNILAGLPINEAGDYTGTFLGLLNPYALLIGVVGLAMFLTHGALYLAMKTEGDLRERFVKWGVRGWMVWVFLYVVATAVSLVVHPALFEGLMGNPIFWVLVVLTLGSLAVIPVLAVSKTFVAFLASSTSIAGMTGLGLLSLFPNLVPSTLNPAWSLSIHDSSTRLTLLVMLVIALIGMPLVIGYQFYIYRVFRGKVTAADGYHH